MSYTKTTSSYWARRYADSFHDRKAAVTHADLFAKVCYLCGAPNTGDPTEHIIPVSCGGLTAPGNLARACDSCNFAKRTDSAEEALTKRLNSGEPTLFSTVEELRVWLDAYMAPYRKAHEAQYRLSLILMDAAHPRREAALTNWHQVLLDYHFDTEFPAAELSILGDLVTQMQFKMNWIKMRSQQREQYITSSRGTALDRLSKAVDPLSKAVYARASSRSVRSDALSVATQGERAIEWLEDHGNKLNMLELFESRVAELGNSQGAISTWRFVVREAGHKLTRKY